MNGVVQIACVALACLTAGTAGACATLRLGSSSERKSLHTQILARARKESGGDESGHLTSFALRYAVRLSREIASGKAISLAARLNSERLQDTRFASWFTRRASWAGCAGQVSVAGFCEASLRLMVFGAFGGVAVGLVFSNMLAALLGVVGAVMGAVMPFASLKRAAKNRTAMAELHLSEMLQVVALGLRSGLSFDRSFELYGHYFDNGFSRSCMNAYRNWNLGLMTRQQALSELADSYNCNQLARVIESMLRSLRFGSPLEQTLEEASAQCRATYRARLEERVAKAPVKMMFPTGTLILPAMLLLVLGPVLLELMRSF